MAKHKGLWHGTKLAVAGIAVVSMCVPLVSSAIADNSSDTTDKLSTTSYKEANYISNASLEGLRDYMKVDVSRLTNEQFKSIVDRAVKVEALTDEDANYQQRWRITWNLSDAQQPKQWKGDGAVPYDGSGFDDMSNPDYSFMVSQDLTVVNSGDNAPRWTVYNRQDPSKILDTFTLPLWKTQSGEVHNVSVPGNMSNKLNNMYYFGQYRDADGHAAPDDWQNKAKACLAGGNTARSVTSPSIDSTCGDYVEWNNGSGKSFAVGQTDMSDASTRYIAGRDPAQTLAQYNKFAPQIGGLQAFEWNTGSWDKSSNNLGQVVSVEFTTQRSPFAGNGNEKVHRTFVAGHYKGNYRSYLYQGTQFKYVEVEDIDSDGDGLSDRFELGIGSDPKNRDTDGDGIEDGVEVESKTPVWTTTGFKITGTDPTVAPQKPSNPAEPTGKRGEVITGQTKPFMTVELYDVTGKKLLGSTVADSNGNYSLEVGKALKRGQINKYGNNIVFSDETNRVPELYDLPAENDIAEGDTAALNFWSDGMDNLPNSEVTRPQFSKPTGTIAVAPKTEPVEVKDPSSLTDAEKNQIKEEVKKNFPDAGDGDITINPDGSATVKVPVTNTTTGEKTTSVVTIPAEDTIAKKQVPSADKSTLAAALSENPDQKPVTGDEMTLSGKVMEDDGSEAGALIADRNVTVVVPQADGTTKSIPAKTDNEGNIVDRTSGKPITFPAAAGEVKLYDGDDTSDSATPLKTTTIAVADPAKAVAKGKPSSAVVNKSVTDMTADITDADGQPVPDGTTVYVKNPVTEAITPVKVTNGSIDIPEFTPTEAGSAKVEIFADNEAKKSIGSATIPVVDKAIDDANSSVAVDFAEGGDEDGNGELNPGDTAQVTGTIADEDGVPIAGRDLTVVLPNGTKIPATTDENGNIVAKDSENGQTTGKPITFTPTEDGTVKVFEGTPENVDPVTSTPVKTADVNVKDRSITSASVDNAPKSGFTGTEISGVTAAVKDGEDDKVASGTVYVKVPGAEKPVAAAISDGKVNIPAFTPTAEGDATIQIFADQDGTKEIGKATVPVTKQTIDAGNSKVTATPSAEGDTTVDTGDTVKVNVTLKDGDSKPIAGRDVTVALPDGTKVNGKTDENGNVVDAEGNSITYTAGEDDGTVKVFDGKDADTENGTPAITKDVPVHNPAPKSAEVTYPKDMNATVANPVKGGKVAVKDKDSNAVPDGTKVYVKNPVTGDVTEVTVKDGKADVPAFTANTPGDYTVEVFADPGASTKIGEKKVPVAAQEVSKDNSELSVNQTDSTDNELNPGDKVSVDGTIKDGKGTPIAGRDLTVVLPDGTVVPATTDENGKIVNRETGEPITYVADKDGEVKVYDGANVDPSTTTDEPILTQKVDVKDRTATDATTDGLPGTITAANPVDGVTVTVVDEDGDVVPDGTVVYVKVPGADAPVALETKDGKVSVPSFTVGEAGEATLIISTDEAGENVIAQQTVTVSEQKPSKDNSNVDVTPSNPNKGDVVTVDGTIKDENGHAMKGADVTIVTPGGKTISATTDANGKIVAKDANGNATDKPVRFKAGKSGDVVVSVNGVEIARVAVKVKAKGALATTGSSVLAVAGLALMALVAGAGVTAVRRRA